MMSFLPGCTNNLNIFIITARLKFSRFFATLRMTGLQGFIVEWGVVGGEAANHPPP